MSSAAPVLIVIGTPHGDWPELARRMFALPDEPAPLPADLSRAAALSAWAGQAGTVCIWPADMSRPLPLDQMALELPSTRFLVFVDSAVASLARSLPEVNAERGLAGWLADWQAASRALLRHVQRYRGRCLCVDAAELAEAPAQLGTLLRDELGVTLTLANLTAMARDRAIDPLSHAVAAAALARHRPVLASCAELLACCAPLDLSVTATAPADGETPDADAAITRLVALWADLSRLGRCIQDAERAQISTQRESELLLLQLHQVQEELEASVLALASAERTVEQGRAHAAELERQLAQEQKLRSDAQTTAQAAGNEASLVAQTLQKKLMLEQREGELLLLQLHQVQEELEHYYLLCTKLQDETTSITAAAFDGLPLRIGDIALRVERDAEPYRELAVLLAGLRVGTRAFADVELRLVEHHGHPGLVVFDSGTETQLLSSWRESGVEDGRRYLLLVPADDKGRALLQAMPTSDWDLTRALVEVLLRWLPAQTLDARWQALARRLLIQLSEQAPRLRYDGLDVQVNAETPSAIDIRMSTVLFGARRWSELRLRWHPDGMFPVELQAPMNLAEPPPLKNWPLDPQGNPQASWPLPLRRGANAREQRQQWQQLDPSDAALLLALLDALPAAAQAMIARQLVDSAESEHLLQAAAEPLREALAQSQPPRWRRMAGALRRRLS
jgi:hypothetical protein